MNAILLCAGFGTRLQPLTDDTPKALVHVAGRPILDYLMEQLVGWPSLEAIHVVHNDRHPEAFARWQAGWKRRSDSPTVRLHDNGVQTGAERRGAVGDLQFAIDRMGTDAPAVVAAGDSLYRVALRPVLDRFQSADAHCVLALPATDDRMLRHSSVFDLDGNRVRGVVPAAIPTRSAGSSTTLLSISVWRPCGSMRRTLPMTPRCASTSIRRMSTLAPRLFWLIPRCYWTTGRKSLRTMTFRPNLPTWNPFNL